MGCRSGCWMGAGCQLWCWLQAWERLVDWGMLLARDRLLTGGDVTGWGENRWTGVLAEGRLLAAKGCMSLAGGRLLAGEGRSLARVESKLLGGAGF